MGKSASPSEAMTLQEHRKWASSLWSRMDRNKDKVMTLEELNCSEFMEAIRAILTPSLAKKTIGSYGRAELNLSQALKYCLKLADTDKNGTLDFQEFEHFLRKLRHPKPPMELATLYMSMFDADPDAFLEEFEFRDMWRYFTGRAPTADEFQMHWSQMDLLRVGRVSKKDLAKWLKKGAPQAFRSLAPPVQGDRPETPPASVTKKPGEIFRPAPGLWHKSPVKWESAHDWNSVPKDFSHINLAWRGSQSMKTYFSRPESLPELRRFYAIRRGFQAQKRKMKAPQPKCPSPVLSEESRQFKSQPGWERHQRLAPNVQGEMAEWKQLTPRRKQARDVGTLLLRVPLPPAPHLVHGRGAEELKPKNASHLVSC